MGKDDAPLSASTRVARSTSRAKLERLRAGLRASEADDRCARIAPGRACRNLCVRRGSTRSVVSRSGARFPGKAASLRWYGCCTMARMDLIDAIHARRATREYSPADVEDGA